MPQIPFLMSFSASFLRETQTADGHERDRQGTTNRCPLPAGHTFSLELSSLVYLVYQQLHLET